MKLVRYMDFKYGIKSIKEGLFKVLSPLSANDPYEMMGACKGRLTARVYDEFLSDLKYRWSMMMADPTMVNKPDDISDVLARAQKNHLYYNKIIMERLIQQQRCEIICFVEADEINDTTDQLMWGHYGEGGTGVRIWFDTDLLPNGFPFVYKVKYQLERPTIDLSKVSNYMHDTRWYDFFRDVLLTKSVAWSYEHEQRMLITPEMQKKWVLTQEGLRFINIPKESIVRIDFGAKGVIPETISQVEDLRQDEQLSKVEFNVATFATYEYKYLYARYDDLMNGESLNEITQGYRFS